MGAFVLLLVYLKTLAKRLLAQLLGFEEAVEYMTRKILGPIGDTHVDTFRPH